MSTNRQLRGNDMRQTLQEEQVKLVQMEKVLVGMLKTIDAAQNDLVLEEFQLKAKQLPDDIVTKIETK